MKAVDTPSFIKKSISIHGKKYEYSDVEYVNSKTKVKIRCKKHGVFEQLPTSHISGKGCMKCARELSSSLRTKTTEKFVAQAALVHGKTYDYSNVIYLKSNQHVIIGCSIHGDFYQTASTHLKGNGCPTCGLYGNSKRKKKREGKVKLTIGEIEKLLGFEIEVVDEQV